jgi:hypothetical protein
MGKEIFSQNVFEKQVNGTIFQKEGRLQDFPYAGDGILESWKYSFDAGKQVFRASNSGKVFEKRIVKDLNGNPQWTTWVEIPDAEAHGIQAIAVNDRPLQLPNSDGAIKLQITPQMLDTYTKSEIYSLIAKKIEEDKNNSYIFVKWVVDPDTGTLATDAKRVLEITYPEGGMITTFYLVEPHPGTSGIQEVAQYFIWDEVQPAAPGGAHGYFDWIEVDIPDMKAFVSYPVFYEHAHDNHQHLSGEFERQAWNAASGLLDVVSGNLNSCSGVSGLLENVSGKLETVSGELHDHISDYGKPDSAHITTEERDNWNYTHYHQKAIPNDQNRYIGLNGEYQLAYEQTHKGAQKNKLIFSKPNLALKSGQSVEESLLAEFNAITAGNNLLLNAQLQIGSFNTMGTSVYFQTAGDADNLAKTSSDFTTSSGPSIWDIGNKAFEKILLLSNDVNKTFSLTNIKLFITYEPLESVEIGDPERKLTLNLVGPDIDPVTHAGEPMYNGVPLSSLIPDASKTAEWGRLTGDINTQNDLNVKLAKLLNEKISHGPVDDVDENGVAIPEAHLRFDVYRDGVIPALIQQPGNEFFEAEIVVPNITRPKKNDVIIGGIQAKLLALKAESKIPYSATLEIEFVSCLEDDNHNQIPVYFETDNPEIPVSPVVASSPFNWQWPGTTFEHYDKIYLRRTDKPGENPLGEGVEFLTNVKLIIRCIKYGDAVLEAKGYQLTANGTNVYVNSSGNIITTAKDYKQSIISGAVDTKIAGAQKVDIANFSEETISGYKTETISGRVTLNYQNNTVVKIGKNKVENIAGNSEQFISGNQKHTVLGNYKLSVSGNYDIDPIEINMEADNHIKLESPLVSLGNETADYDGATGTILIRGEEIDTRFAGRDNFENYASGETYERISGNEFLSGELENEIANRVSGDYYLDTELRELNTHLLAVSGEIDFYNQKFSGLISGEVYDRISGDADLQNQLDKEIQDRQDEDDILDNKISGEVYNRISGDAYLQAQHNTLSGYVSGNIYTKVETDEQIKNAVHNVIAIDGEYFDLVINDSAELEEVLEDGTFESSERILFKRGAYTYTGNTEFNFDNVRYVKGEEPVYVESTINIKPNSSEKTLFETIKIKLRDITIESTGRIAEFFELASVTETVPLDKYHSLYQLLVNTQTSVLFDNVESGREYTFYFDQPDSVANQFEIVNTLHNANEDLKGFALSNLAPNSRTVVKAIGSNFPFVNGLIITEVIPLVATTSSSGGNPVIRIDIGNIKGKIHNSNTFIDAVNIFGFNPENPGSSTINIDSEFVDDSWTHHPSGVDFKIYLETDINKTALFSGRIGERLTIKLPAGSPGVTKYILDCDIVPNLYKVVLASNLNNTIIDQSVLEGFSKSEVQDPQKLTWYQPRHNSMDIYCDTTTDYYLDALLDSEGHSSNQVVPWHFVLPCMPKNVPETLIIDLKYWIRIKSLANTVKVVSPSMGLINSLIKGRSQTVKFTVLDPVETTWWSDSMIYLIGGSFDPAVITSHGNYDPVTHTMQMTIADNAPDVISFQIVVPRRINHDAAGTLIVDFGISSTNPVTDLSIVDDRDPAYVDASKHFYKSVNRSETYNFHINWNPVPFYKDGTWTINNPDVADIVKTGAGDEATLTVKKQGDFIITFVSKYDNSKVATFNGFVHALPVKVEINPVSKKKTSTTNIQATLTWRDEGDHVVNPTRDLTDYSGKWELDDLTNEYIDISVDGLMNFFPFATYDARHRIPVGQSSVFEKIKFTSNDCIYDEANKTISSNHLVVTLDIEIVRNSYQLEFRAADSSISVSNLAMESSKDADTVVNVDILMNSGKHLNSSVIAFLESELGPRVPLATPGDLTSLGQPKNGFLEALNEESRYNFAFRMPYKDLVINLSTN